MRRIIGSVLLMGLLALGTTAPVLGHGGGHQGGCAAFGQFNRVLGQDPGAFGFPWARNLGDLVSTFAQLDDGRPGVAEIVEDVDHAACG